MYAKSNNIELLCLLKQLRYTSGMEDLHTGYNIEAGNMFIE